MSTILLEKKSGTVFLNPSLFALFAKACYLKNREDEFADRYNSAETSLTEWNTEFKQNIEGWEVITGVEGIGTDGVSSEWAGFQAVAYKNEATKEIVIAYRGTDSLLDGIISDAQIAFNLTPQQTSPALEFYNKIAASVSGEDYTISVTGHSLGGSLAQYVAAVKGISAVTFNGPGIPMPEGGDASGIVNYVNMNDFIGCLNTHIGETRYYLPDGIYLDGKFKPHSDYVGADFSKYIVLPSNVTWSLGYSLALWGYDVNNTTNSSLKVTLSTLITKPNLDNAVQIIEEYLGKPGKLDTSFKYQLPNNYCYCIGSTKDDVFTGTNKNDTLWGNGGNDLLTGGKGNDTLDGGGGVDEYVFVTGDGQDIIQETDEELTSVKDILYSVKDGRVNINSHILTGGTYNETTGQYVSNDVGVTYSWSGFNGSDLVISYGTGDSVTVV